MSTRKRKNTAENGLSEVLAGMLGKHRLFDGLSAEEIAEIVERIGGGVRRFAKDEIVVYEGTKAKWIVPVLKGQLAVYESGTSGERHLARVVGEGGLFGATMMTANLETYPGMAVANLDCTVAFLEIAKVKAMWREGRHARFFENLYSTVCGEVLESWQKLSVLACRKTEDRFMLYLRWRAAETGKVELQLPFATSEACAQYLGVTRTALSLAVKRLDERGEIKRLGRGRFALKN